MNNPREIIVHPLVTEKSTSMREINNAVAFCVKKNATKRQVKMAVEEIFKVKVIDVRTMVYLGKMRRLGRFTGRKPSWKKAIVTLAAGSTIPLFEGI
jgi:large subunit ribosomal protein L23